MNLLYTTSVLAQPATQESTDTPEKIVERRAEQALPRKAAPFDPANFDKYAESYELSPVAVGGRLASSIKPCPPQCRASLIARAKAAIRVSAILSTYRGGGQGSAL